MLKTDVVKKAEGFCKKHNIFSYPIDIISLCNKEGIKVFERYLPSDVSGFIIAQEESLDEYGANKVIVVNLLDSPKRRRFTIAHELAHYILHKDDNELYAHRDAGQNDSIEREANIFASNVLMPKDLIEDELNSLKSQCWDEVPGFIKIQHIANKFAVSESAAEVRLSQLNML